VKWRTGGSGPWDGRQFERNGDAKRFKALVEANGHTMPPPEQLVEHGFGHLAPAGAVAPAPQPAEVKLTFRAYAEDGLGTLVMPHPETVRKYRERLEKQVFPRLERSLR
jgi:hypothetical protein